MKTLLKIQGVLSYTLILFLNAMTDLGHKIILQNTIFKAYEGTELIILTAIVNALILLPFILLFSPAGKISDKYPKTKVIEYASLLAIGVTMMILISYIMGWFWVAFGLTFVLAGQSAIYSPAKYGLIKELMGEENIANGNALVQSTTIIAILFGAFFYSIFFEYLLQDKTIIPSEILTYIVPVGYMLIGATIIEYLFARKLSKEVTPKIILSKSTEHKEENEFIFKLLKKDPLIMFSVLGLGTVWGVAQVLGAVFGEHLKTHLGITNTIISQGLLTLIGVGIVFGSLFAGYVSKHHIERGLVFIGMYILSIVLFMIPTVYDLWTLGILLSIFGFSAGLILVPLNATIQLQAPANILGKILAGNNLMQSLFMFTLLVSTAILAYFEISPMVLFYLITALASAMAFVTLVITPFESFRYLLKLILRIRYKLEIEGLENIPNDGRGVLFLSNHVSFIDGIILQMAYHKQIRYVIDRYYYEKWYLKPFLDFLAVIPISPRGSKKALEEVTNALNNGDVVALFPEGHLTYTGQMDSFQKGFQVATAGVTNAVIIPVYLRGLWEDKYSRASSKMKAKKSRLLGINFGKEIDIHSTPLEVKEAIFDLSIKSWITYSHSFNAIPKLWIHTSKKVGSGLCMADSTGAKVSGHRFATGVFMIASSLKKSLKNSQNIGVVLPTSVGGAIANMSLFTLGKTVVNLNYSSGVKSLLYALEDASIKQIITSKLFITKLKAKGFDLTEVLEKVEVIYLEDIKEKMSKVKGLLTLIFVKVAPTSLLNLIYITKKDTNDTTAILFSSGSEGKPKGIELTHKNLIGNVKQCATLFNPNDKDVMLGTLPIFHSFGFMATMLLPLLEGIPLVAHPDPTDGYAIGKLSAQYKATILLGTATFYRLYTRNKKLIPLMFKDIRLAIAGAEKLPKEIREAFKHKFDIDIHEGYGATETSPAVGVNIEDVLRTDDWKVHKAHKQGTIGLPVVGTNFKIVTPDTFEPLALGEEGMILIGGVQVMKGYLNNPEKTKEVIKEIDGIRWYVTGDKGSLDEDGFLTIVDRYSRFAKIAGEMVSLGMVERELSKCLQEDELLSITALPDIKKGEKLVLLLEGDINLLKSKIKELEINPLLLPSEYFEVETIPKLGTGKSDFAGIKRLAMKLLE